jgi:SAM-dependent methyltransferase
MTENDKIWMRRILAAKAIKGPVLELGVGYGGDTCRSLIEKEGMSYLGTDLTETPAVDFVADFERAEDMRVFTAAPTFGTVLILNVLEHTFDPIRVLDNAISLLEPAGKCAVLTPSVWPLHNYPMDAWRILPNFYDEYARRRGLTMDDRFFEFPGHGSVESLRDTEGNYHFPAPGQTAGRYLWSRIIHKVFNTCGRAMAHPSYIVVGALFQKPCSNKDRQVSMVERTRAFPE